MKPPAPKLSALVVSAIRNLREARGSTAKDIMNYISTEYNSGDSLIQRQMTAALKRGVEYGILTRQNGHYSLNSDPFFPNPQNMVPEDRARRRKRRGRRSGRRRGGRRGRRPRRRGRRTTMKVQRRGKLNRKQPITIRHVNRRSNEEIENDRDESALTERSRAEHSPAEHRPADVEVPKRGSSKGRERSTSRSRSSRSPPRISSKQPSRQASPAESQSSDSSDPEEQEDNHDD